MFYSPGRKLKKKKKLLHDSRKKKMKIVVKVSLKLNAGSYKKSLALSKKKKTFSYSLCGTIWSEKKNLVEFEREIKFRGNLSCILYFLSTNK